MRILVSAASKHGGTAEIAQHIAEVLRMENLEVAVIPAGEVVDIAGFDAVVLGSAVYYGRWLPAARELCVRAETELRQRPVWLFSSGPVGPAAADPERVPVDADKLAAQIGAVEHRMFGGRILRDRLGLIERWIAARLGVTDRDDRDWKVIATWAKSIASRPADSSVN